ncbi:MAG: hypothetical protein NC191_06940 [Muribaculaceae bacterium]|nr:hypothetical protein [Muribaculaceae bacterium]
MAYDKNTWVDQVVERPRTYEMTNNADGSVTLIDSFGLVSELGTPVNAVNMNHIEEGIEACDLRKYNAFETYNKSEWATDIVDGIKKIFQSKKDDNLGNPVTDTNWWEEVKLGSSSFGSGFNLFDTKLSDHILEGDEALGWALQGTYVYKDSAPERAGYPDFYNKCLEEKAAGVETQTTLGSSTITTYNNANGHIFFDIADKAVVDAYYESTGVAWFYGIDEENERVFLPRSSQTTKSVTPNLDYNAKIGVTAPTTSAHFTAPFDGVFICTFSVNNNYNLFFNINGVNTQKYSDGSGVSGAVLLPFFIPMKKGDVGYWNNATLSDYSGYFVPYATGEIKTNPEFNYLYMCVGNAEVTSAVTDVTEITTSENDTTPLFTGMYFDFTPNHPSWLKAGIQQNSGGVYTSCYNTLVNCLTEANNIYDLKVIEEAEMIAGVDYSEYWKVNQDSQYFITPTKLSYSALSTGNNGTIPVTGDGKAMCLTKDGTGCSLYLSVNGASNPDYLGIHTAIDYPTGVPLPNGAAPANLLSTGLIGLSTVPAASGAIAHLADAQSTTAQLYFKVANALQNLELLNVGEVMEALSDKTDMAQAANASMPSSRHINLTLGASGTTYTAPSTGWVVLSSTSNGANQILSLNGLVSTFAQHSASGQNFSTTIPVLKGSSFTIWYSTPSSATTLRFVYGEGSN